MNLSTEQSARQPSWLEVVKDQVRPLRFGYVQITVDISQVVQVETTSRLRFNNPSHDSEASH